MIPFHCVAFCLPFVKCVICYFVNQLMALLRSKFIQVNACVLSNGITDLGKSILFM